MAVDVFGGHGEPISGFDELKGRVQTGADADLVVFVPDALPGRPARASPP